MLAGPKCYRLPFGAVTKSLTLDFLVPFRESRSIRPEVRYMMWANKMQDVRDWIERLSPETTKRGVVDILRLTPESFKFTRGPARTCTDNLPLSLGELRPISINLEAWPSPVAGDNGGGSLTSVNHLCPRVC